MQKDLGALLVYDVGESILVGFKDIEIIDDSQLDMFREGLEQLIKDHNCKKLVVNLSGVKIVSSGILGFLFLIQRQGTAICLYNPSEGVKEVLEITKLGTLFKVVDTPHG